MRSARSAPVVARASSGEPLPRGAARRTVVPLSALELLTKAHISQPEALVQGDYLRLWPHRHGTDGFFAAAWQRR